MPITTTDTDVSKEQVMLQLLVFNLGSEEYALPLTDVREITKTPEITPVPNMADTVKGVVNLRGKVVTIIDLSKVFGLESGKLKVESGKREVEKQTDEPKSEAPEKASTSAKATVDKDEANEAAVADVAPVAAVATVTNQHIIIAERGEELFGLLVDSATEVLRTEQDHLKQTPDMLQSSIHADFVKGVVVIEAGNAKTGKEETESTEEKRLILHLNLERILNDFTSAEGQVPEASPTTLS